MESARPEKPELTPGEQQLVDSIMLGIRLTIKALVTHRTIPVKTIASGIVDQAKDLVGVAFWQKYGAWLRDEILKRVAEISGSAHGNEETPRD